jgi:hypothetical protein
MNVPFRKFPTGNSVWKHGQLEHDSQNKTARTGETERDSHNRRDREGQREQDSEKNVTSPWAQEWESTGQPEQDSKTRTATARTGQWERTAKERTARTGQAEWDCWDKTARKALPGRTGVARQDTARIKNCQDRTAGAEKPERKARSGQLGGTSWTWTSPRKENPNRTARTGQQGQEIQATTVKTGLPGQDRKKKAVN